MTSRTFSAAGLHPAAAAATGAELQDGGVEAVEALQGEFVPAGGAQSQR